MSRLGFVDGSTVAIGSQPTAENGQVVVARTEDEVALKRFVRLDGRRVELRPESFDPTHQAIQLALEQEPGFALRGVAVGALLHW